MTDQELSDLAASQVKAEINGKTELAQELQAKLDRARQLRKNHMDEQKQANDEVLLTVTNSKGTSRPFQSSESDMWGGRAGRKAKKQKVETHVDGERVRYFADDDNYNLKQMVRRLIRTCVQVLFLNHLSLFFLVRKGEILQRR